MTMSAKPTTAEKIGVTLVRLGVGSEEHALAEGATLADLLREAQGLTNGQTVLINGKPLEEVIALQSGMTVTLVPMAKNPVIDQRWRESIGMFKDDPGFQEMVDAGRAYRESLREAEEESEDDEA
jgi:sulfur carrier protein ThiS